MPLAPLPFCCRHRVALRLLRATPFAGFRSRDGIFDVGVLQAAAEAFTEIFGLILIEHIDIGDLVRVKQAQTNPHDELVERVVLAPSNDFVFAD